MNNCILCNGAISTIKSKIELLWKIKLGVMVDCIFVECDECGERYLSSDEVDRLQELAIVEYDKRRIK